jgi:hypothetical protein
MKQGLVEQRAAGRQRTLYLITQRGMTVLNYFIELKQVLPIEDEDDNLTREPNFDAMSPKELLTEYLKLRKKKD